MPTRADADDEDDEDAGSARIAFLLRASTAHDLAKRIYGGPVDAEVMEVVDLTAAAWAQLAAQLKAARVR